MIIQSIHCCAIIGFIVDFIQFVSVHIRCRIERQTRANSDGSMSMKFLFCRASLLVQTGHMLLKKDNKHNANVIFEQLAHDTQKGMGINIRVLIRSFVDCSVITPLHGSSRINTFRAENWSI